MIYACHMICMNIHHVMILCNVLVESDKMGYHQNMPHIISNPYYEIMLFVHMRKETALCKLRIMFVMTETELMR